MIHALQNIIGAALERLSQQLSSDLPPLLAALTILFGALLIARLARWMIRRAFKGITADQWLRRSGLSSMIDRSGTLRASRLVAQCAYWGILIAGVLAALNVFGTRVTMRMADGVMLLLPRLVAAAAIILAGLWTGQYVGRGVLIWAVNEDLPSPRRLATLTRTLVVFGAVVIAADTVDFARGVFLAAFILILGGLVIAASIAIGFGARDTVHRYLEGRARPHEAHQELPEHSLWNHL